jgi:hypothetical protein
MTSSLDGSRPSGLALKRTEKQTQLHCCRVLHMSCLFSRINYLVARKGYELIDSHLRLQGVRLYPFPAARPQKESAFVSSAEKFGKGEW